MAGVYITSLNLKRPNNVTIIANGSVGTGYGGGGTGGAGGSGYALIWWNENNFF